MSNEKELVFSYRLAKHKVAELEEALKAAKASEMSLEHEIIEHLEEIGADATAEYEGVTVKLQKPRLFASYLKENEERVFEFAKKEGREDLIKPTIHPSSLSSWVKERIESGLNVPEFLSYYLKPIVRIYQ